MDPESFAAKAMNPKKRKPDPETECEGISRHPTAKRKPDGATETPMASASASPSASQEPPTVEMETPSESHSRSASGLIEPPHAQPTRTPLSTGEGTDVERQEEVLVVAAAVEREVDELPLEIMTPEEQLIVGVPERDIQSFLYLAYPEIVEAREYIDPIIHKFMSSLKPNDMIENEDRLMNELTPTCFNETYDQLMIDPLDEDIQTALGLAVEAFPQLLPKVFKTYRSIGKRMIARQAAERRKIIEEAQQEEPQTGNNIPEFTQLLMTSLEQEVPSREPWDTELRTTLTDQLIEFLQQNTSVDPDYLVKEYERYLQQLITAQNNRLREKHGDNRVGMLKESGVIKRIITRIPDIALETFKNHKYNPDKKGNKDPVFAEAEYEEEVEEEEVQQTSTPKRPGSTIPPPEAKMAARPDSVTSYRNPKQEVIPSEAQMQGRS